MNWLFAICHSKHQHRTQNTLKQPQMKQSNSRIIQNSFLVIFLNVISLHLNFEFLLLLQLPSTHSTVHNVNRYIAALGRDKKKTVHNFISFRFVVSCSYSKERRKKKEEKITVWCSKFVLRFLLFLLFCISLVFYNTFPSFAHVITCITLRIDSFIPLAFAFSFRLYWLHVYISIKDYVKKNTVEKKEEEKQKHQALIS